MARRPTRKRHSAGMEDLNLTPVMNVFIILIPFLLLTTVFVKTAIINVYLPGNTSDREQTDRANSERILTLHMTRDGFSFSGLGKEIPPVKKDNSGSYDFGLLNSRVAALKERYPKHEEAIILFAPDTPYELVIKAMDATREVATSKQGKITRKTLFPVISVGEHTKL